MTEEVGEGNKEQFHLTFRQALRSIIWISLPVSIIAFFSRGYVVSFIKNGGDRLIANLLATLVVAILARSVFHIAARGFYDEQDTKTPFIVSVIAIGGTIALSLFFALVLNWGPEGLGWAQSIGAVAEIIILMAILQIRSRGKLLNTEFWRAFLRMLFATVITGCVAYSMTKFFPLMADDNSFFSIFPKFCLITLSSAIAYLLASYFLELDEVKPIFARLNKILYRNITEK